MIKRLGKTGTRLDDFTSFSMMHQDEGVNRKDLIRIIQQAGHLKGVARAVVRHGNCDEPVLAVMRQSATWWVRLIGYFNYTRDPMDIQRDVQGILAGTRPEPHGQIRARAAEFWQEQAVREMKQGPSSTPLN